MGRAGQTHATRGTRSGFLLLVGIMLAAAFAVVLAAFLGAAEMFARLGDQLQATLTSSLDLQINAASERTSFSGTLYDISDDLLGDPTLAALGACASEEELVSDADGLQAGERLLSDCLERTTEAPAARYFYFSHADYLMSADVPGANARGTASDAVESLLDDLRDGAEAKTGAYENHIGTTGGGGQYQVMARAVAPGAYYVVGFDSLFARVPDGFEELEDVQLYYYDQFGAVVACTEPDTLLDAYTYDSLGSSDTGVVTCRVGGVEYMGIYCTSHARNLRMAVFFQNPVAVARTQTLGLLGIVAFAILVCFVATFLAIRRAYRPLRSIASRLAQRQGADARPLADGDAKGGRLQDEGAVIAGALSSLDTMLARQRDLLGEAWLTRLASGQRLDSLEGYEDAWALGLRDRPYLAIIVRSDALPETRDGHEDEAGVGVGGDEPVQPGEKAANDDDARNGEADARATGANADDEAWRDVVRTWMARTFDCRRTELDGHEAFIVTLADVDEDEAALRLASLCDGLPDLALSAFASEEHRGLDDVARAFREALDVSRYCQAQETYGVVMRYAQMREAARTAEGGCAGMELLPQLARSIKAIDAPGALATYDEAAELLGRTATGTRILKGDATSPTEPRTQLLRSCVSLAYDDLATGLQDETRAATLAEASSRAREAQTPAQLRRQLQTTLRALDDDRGRPAGRELYERMENLVRRGFRDPNLSAGAIARHLGVSQSYITRLFRRYNGTTFVEYVHELRLDHAAEMLRETDMTEAQVAQAVGYGNTITMIRAFKKYRGVTPSALRR